MQRSAVDELTDAVLTASRVLVSIAAASLAGVSETVTLPQYRALVVLQSRGPQGLQDLAAELQVVPSTATRMCDRLEGKGLIDRQPAKGSRREVRLSVTAEGQAIVSSVSRRRRARIRQIVERMSSDEQRALVSALESFAAAAGEAPEDDWYLGWS
jgi:DNA-binding MarR family transcriptional regulator